MTKDEINKKISELRDEWDYEVHPSGWWRRPYAKNWHLDANWPTLLRSMPEVSFWQNPNKQWTCEPDAETGTIIERKDDISEAVCLAYLAWANEQ